MDMPATDLNTTDQPIEDIPPHLGVLSTMCTEGDIKYTWDPKNAWEVAAARNHFENLKRRGFRIFRMKKRKKDGETEVQRFDPTHGKTGYLIEPPKPEDALQDDWVDVQGADGELAEPDPETSNHYVAVPPIAGG